MESRTLADLKRKESDFDYSDDIAEIAVALCKAQAVMGHAAKDSSNPFFKSKYADLASVIDASRKALTDNALTITQLPGKREGLCSLDTMLIHSSGQYMRSRLLMKPTKADPQGEGSCYTYMRRYAMSAIIGLTQDDDDANAASTKGSVSPIKGSANKTQAPDEPMNYQATDTQKRRLAEICKNLGVTETSKMGEISEMLIGVPMQTLAAKAKDYA